MLKKGLLDALSHGHGHYNVMMAPEQAGSAAVKPTQVGSGDRAKQNNMLIFLLNPHNSAVCLWQTTRAQYGVVRTRLKMMTQRKPALQDHPSIIIINFGLHFFCSAACCRRHRHRHRLRVRSRSSISSLLFQHHALAKVSRGGTYGMAFAQ